MTPQPRRTAAFAQAAGTMPPASSAIGATSPELEDETLGEYSDRMRETYSREYALELLKTLAPTHTYKRALPQ